MFTGLIQEIGKVKQLESAADMVTLRVQAPGLRGQGIQPGDSIAVNGICLTLTALISDGFVASMMRETIDHTTVGQWKTGDGLNLERALTLSTPLDGHLVSGHVDGTARVAAIRAEGAARRLEFELELGLIRYVARKGSVAIDGVSLTVAEIVAPNRFSVALIPYTQAKTTLNALTSGKSVNVEVDLLARYVERLTAGNRGATLTKEQLLENGF
jgi:riboflavin synthase